MKFDEPLLMLSHQLSMASRRAVGVEWSGLKQDWNLVRRSLSLRDCAVIIRMRGSKMSPP